MRGMMKFKAIVTVLGIDLNWLSSLSVARTKIKDRRNGFSSWYPSDLLLGGVPEQTHITHCL